MFRKWGALCVVRLGRHFVDKVARRQLTVWVRKIPVGSSVKCGCRESAVLGLDCSNHLTSMI